MTRVKICGITNLEDALLSAKFGADALGFNFYKQSPRYISPERAREIIEQLPPEILKVGVFVNESLENIAQIAETARLDALQLHGEETPEFARELKAKTGLEIIKAFRVSPAFEPEDVLKYETDAILLDAYNPREHGGTGETFDWKIARKVQEIFPKMYLAGGLSHENVSSAIWNTKVFAVDVCSGVEDKKGKKDKVKLINFLKSVKNRDKAESIFILKEEKIKNIYDLLDSIQPRPEVLLGSKSLTVLRGFLTGYLTACGNLGNPLNGRDFLKIDFVNFVDRKLSNEIPTTDWSSIILSKCGDNEEKAFDVFFALLEEFKLEKEDLNNE